MRQYRLHKPLFLLFILITQTGYLLGPNTFPEERLYGWWTGRTNDLYADNVEHRWLINHKSDNTFEVYFKYYQHGQLLNTTHNYGKWWIEKNILYLDYQGAIIDGMQQPNEESPPQPYRIHSVDNAEYVYELLENNYVFTAHRADRHTEF